MAKRFFTTPKTYSASGLVSASDRNTFESQNIDYLANPPTVGLQTDHEGDVKVTELRWHTLDMVLRTQSGVTDSFDSDDGHATGAGRITVQEAGLYYLVAQIAYESDSTEVGRELAVFKVGEDGAPDEVIARDTHQNEASFGSDCNIAVMVRLAEGDVLEARTKHSGTEAKIVRNRPDNVTPGEFQLIRLRGDDFVS